MISSHILEMKYIQLQFQLSLPQIKCLQCLKDHLWNVYVVIPWKQQHHLNRMCSNPPEAAGLWRGDLAVHEQWPSGTMLLGLMEAQEGPVAVSTEIGTVHFTPWDGDFREPMVCVCVYLAMHPTWETNDCIKVYAIQQCSSDLPGLYLHPGTRNAAGDRK